MAIKSFKQKLSDGGFIAELNVMRSHEAEAAKTRNIWHYKSHACKSHACAATTTVLHDILSIPSSIQIIITQSLVLARDPNWGGRGNHVASNICCIVKLALKPINRSGYDAHFSFSCECIPDPDDLIERARGIIKRNPDLSALSEAWKISKAIDRKPAKKRQEVKPTTTRRL